MTTNIEYLRIANEKVAGLSVIESGKSDTGSEGLDSLVDIAQRIANNMLADIDWDDLKPVLDIVLPVDDVGTVLAILKSGAVRIVISPVAERNE